MLSCLNSLVSVNSAYYREEDRETMPMLKHFGVGVIPWGPLGAGCECKSSLLSHPLSFFLTRRKLLAMLKLIDSRKSSVARTKISSGRPVAHTS